MYGRITIAAGAAHFSICSRENSFSNRGAITADKFTLDGKSYDITTADIENIPELAVIKLESDVNLTFTIRGPLVKRDKLVKHLKEKPDLLQAIIRSKNLYAGELNQNITIILADKYDYLGNGRAKKTLIILNASDLEEAVTNEKPLLASELLTSILSVELACQRGGGRSAETEEMIAQDSAHATRYFITHQPYAPRLSEYIAFLKKYALEIKGWRDYLAYLKVMNRYEDIEWTKRLAPLVAERSAWTFQMENTFSKSLLENIYNKLIEQGYSRKDAETAVGKIAKLTTAGGLGNIKRDLGSSWHEKGVDIMSITPLYGRWIKGEGEIDRGLVDLLLSTMGEPLFSLKTKIFNRHNIKEEIEVNVRIYRDPFSPSQCWIYCPEVFDGVYPDADTDIGEKHLAQQLLLYRKASLGFLKFLKGQNQMKQKFLFSLSEVYTAFLVPDVIKDEYHDDPDLKDIFIHHYNHTVVSAGMPTLPAYLYGVIGIDEKYKDSIIVYNKYRDREEISLAKLIGKKANLISGCSMAHTRKLIEEVMAEFKDKIPESISKVNSEGVYLDHWMGEEMQKVYERYFLRLDAGDDHDLFDKLDNDDKQKQSFISDMLEAKERERANSKEWRESQGAMLNPKFKVASLTRRVVPYKRFDIVNAMIGSNKYMTIIKKLDIGFLGGGRIFARNDRDYGAIQIHGAHYLADLNPGYLAMLSDYNIFTAHIIYEGDDIVIMLSNEGQEAGPTSPSKGLVNGAIIVASPDGVIPELLIDFSEDPLNGNGFRVEYREPEIQEMVKQFLNNIDYDTKKGLLEKGRNGAGPFEFNTSQGKRIANSAGLRDFFNKWNELIESMDIERIFNPLEDYFTYVISLFGGIDNAGEIVNWLIKIRDDKELEYHERYSYMRSFLIEMLGYPAEPTVKSLVKAIENAGNALKDPDSERRLFYNALKTGILNANISTRQGPGLIRLWEEGLLKEQLVLEGESLRALVNGAVPVHSAI